jgi:DNA-binding helix-hairpin-helix protein with protein kinase domain
MAFALDDLAIAGTVGSAGASGFGQGIFGASEADRQNQEAQAQYEAQVKQQEKIARKTNEYNKEAFQVDKANYKAQRNYQYNIAKQDWQRQNEIQDFQYLQSLLEEQRDLRIRDRAA